MSERTSKPHSMSERTLKPFHIAEKIAKGNKQLSNRHRFQYI